MFSELWLLLYTEKRLLYSSRQKPYVLDTYLCLSYKGMIEAEKISEENFK
jgi:hypothetical protein